MRPSSGVNGESPSDRPLDPILRPADLLLDLPNSGGFIAGFFSCFAFSGLIFVQARTVRKFQHERSQAALR
jgi:hypothetical protein